MRKEKGTEPGSRWGGVGGTGKEEQTLNRRAESGLKSHREETMISRVSAAEERARKRQTARCLRFGIRKLSAQYPGEIRRVGAKVTLEQKDKLFYLN